MKNGGRHDNLSFEIYDSIILHALDYNHDYMISFKIWAQIWLKDLVLDITVKSTTYGSIFCWFKYLKWWNVLLSIKY